MSGILTAVDTDATVDTGGDATRRRTEMLDDRPIVREPLTEWSATATAPPPAPSSTAPCGRPRAWPAAAARRRISPRARPSTTAADRALLPEAAVLASLGCGNPMVVAELQPGRGGARPRVRRRDRRPALGGARRPDRLRLRPRHDRRDARAGAPERRRGRCHERRVPQGPDRGRSRSMPRASTSSSATASSTSPPTRPRSSARSRGSCGRAGAIGVSDVVADDDLSPASARSAAASSAASRAPSRSASTAPASPPSASPTSRSAPTHAEADGLYGALVRATKPRDWTPAVMRDVDLPKPAADLPMVAGDGCCGGAAAAERRAAQSVATGNGNAIGSLASRLRPSASNRSRPSSATSTTWSARRSRGRPRPAPRAGPHIIPWPPAEATERPSIVSPSASAPGRRSAGGRACSRSWPPRSGAVPGRASPGPGRPAARASPRSTASRCSRASPGRSSGSLHPNSRPPSSSRQ